jgi:4-methyl-5(b-hydroxyethyl)-thiazole monophosphate biosynthesis
MIKVLMFLGKGFEALEASAFSDVIGWASIHGDRPISLTTFGLRRKVKSKWNFQVEPELAYGEFDYSEFDALAIPGGFGDAGFYEDAYDERFLGLIRDFGLSKKIIATICVGALPLAKAGMLKNKLATTYDIGSPDRTKQLEEFNVHISRNHIVCTDNVITSRGPATSLEVAFKLLEILTDRENVGKVKHYMRFDEY